MHQEWEIHHVILKACHAYTHFILLVSVFPDDQHVVAHDGPSTTYPTDVINSNDAQQQQQFGVNLVPPASSQLCSASNVSLMSDSLTQPPTSLNIPAFIPVLPSNAPVLTNATTASDTRSAVVVTFTNQTPAIPNVSSPSTIALVQTTAGVVTHPRMLSVSSNMGPLPAHQQGIMTHRPDMMQIRPQPMMQSCPMIPGLPRQSIHMQQHVGMNWAQHWNTRMTQRPPSIPSPLYNPCIDQIQSTMMSEQAYELSAIPMNYHRQVQPHHWKQHPALDTVEKNPNTRQHGLIMGPQYQSVTPSVFHHGGQNIPVDSHSSPSQILSQQQQQTMQLTTMVQPNLHVSEGKFLSVVSVLCANPVYTGGVYSPQCC